MTITNKYYIIPLSLPENIKQFLVNSDPSTLRKNNTETLAVVKRRADDNENRPEFNAFLEYDHAGILVEMRKPQWVTAE